MGQIYYTSLEDVTRYIGMLEKDAHLEISDSQRLMLEKIYSNMNQETLLHCLNTAKFADAYIQKYNEGGNSFEKDFGISEQQFKMGMAIHDVGKTLVAKNVLEFNGKYNDEQRAEIDAHSNPDSKKCLSTKALNKFLKEINTEQGTHFKDLSEMGFPPEVTDICSHHHPKRIFKMGLKNYFAAAAIVDDSEAASGKRKYFEKTGEWDKIGEKEKEEKEILDKANSWTQENTQKFYENSKKENDSEAHRMLGRFNSFVTEVVSENQRHFKPLSVEEPQLENMSKQFKEVQKELDKKEVELHFSTAPLGL